MTYNRWYIMVLLAGATGVALSQNLIPNAGFERSTGLVYTDPASAFAYLDNWYPGNIYTQSPSTRGTPDLFDSDNRWPPSDPPSFWNIAYQPFEGNFHVGIANHFRYEGYATPEIVATELTRTLEPGALYHVQLQVRNKGISTYQDGPAQLCVPEQYKALNVLLHPDSIFMTLDGFSKDSYANASRVIEFRSPSVVDNVFRDWFPLGTCFEANGDERFFAVTSMPGRFTVDPPCVIYDEHWDAFYVYYFDVDDVSLTRLPESLAFVDTICAGRGEVVDIAQLAALPIMKEEIEYLWDDGTEGPLNAIFNAGTYEVEIVIDCGSILVTLEVMANNCETNVYVPNIFSPNDDGINDVMEIHVDTDQPIVNFDFVIYDRWGNLVYTTNDPDVGWDGMIGNVTAASGVYVWSMTYTIDDFEFGHTSFRRSGDVTILR